MRWQYALSPYGQLLVAYPLIPTKAACGRCCCDYLHVIKEET